MSASDETTFPASDSAAIPPGGIPSKFADPAKDSANQLALAHDGSRVHVAFKSKDVPDETRVAGYRAQLLSFIQRTGCHSLTFDLEGLKLLPSRMLGFFLTLKNEGHDIELVNVAPFIQDIFRVTKLAPIVTIRSGQ